MIRKFVLAALAVCFLTAPAKADKVYIVASDPTWPPMEFLDADKNVVGFSPDYIRAVAKEGGFEVEVRNIAWDGIFASIENNQADIICSSVTVTPEREKRYAFSEPYFVARQTVVVPVDSTISKMSDLSGKNVGGQIGTTGLIQTMKNAKKSGEAKDVTLKSYDEVGLAIEDMMKGGVDAVICDSPVAAYYAFQKEEYKGKMKAAFSTDPGEDAEYFALVLRKGDDELLDKVNKGIKAVKEKGIDKQLLAKWNMN